MSSPTERSAIAMPLQPFGQPLRVAFVGSPAWLGACAPPPSSGALAFERFDTSAASDPSALQAALAEFRPAISVVFDPPAFAAPAWEELAGATLGVVVGQPPPEGSIASLASLDRLISFDPAMSGMSGTGAELWRAVPPPVSDGLFGEVRPLHRAPRAMTIGRSSDHRETMLMPAKHHHDLLQVIHGLSGEELRELLALYDVGVYVAPSAGGGFGAQVAMHLAAGQLLLTEALTPQHGLERNIDYVQIDSADGLVWALERLTRFPEMHHRIRVRGRLKAEQFRASRLFARLAHDLLADVAAFG